MSTSSIKKISFILAEFTILLPLLRVEIIFIRKISQFRAALGIGDNPGYWLAVTAHTKLNLKVNLCGADFSFCLS